MHRKEPIVLAAEFPALHGAHAKQRAVAGMAVKTF